MQRWEGLSAVEADFGPSVVTIGNFDGVHRGHAAVLARVVATARSRAAAAVAVTFDPHPLQVLDPDRAPGLLTGLDHRLELMETAGLDAVLVMPFTAELASWSPERFVVDVFVRALGAQVVVVGHDVRFGSRNSGDLTTMRELGARHGFEVAVLEDLGDPRDGSPRWSSTAVRDALAAGDAERAAAVLGHLHRVTAVVVHGDHRGRELGYPTANLSTVTGDTEGLVPADGVYAGWVVVGEGTPEEDRMPSAISVGTNPTFDGLERRVEAYCIDRTGLDLYGERVAVEFVRRLRPTLRFDGIDPLVVQMGRDVDEARRLLTGAGRPAADADASR